MRKHSGRTAAAFGVAAAAWVALLFFFSGQSGEDSGSLSLWVTEIFFGWALRLGADADRLHIFVRKLAHAGFFAVEGLLTGLSLGQLLRPARTMAAGGAFCAAVAVANELHQKFSAGRHCSVADMLIDTLGALAGLAAAAVILHLFRLRHGRNHNTETIR